MLHVDHIHTYHVFVYICIYDRVDVDVIFKPMVCTPSRTRTRMCIEQRKLRPQKTERRAQLTPRVGGRRPCARRPPGRSTPPACIRLAVQLCSSGGATWCAPRCSLGREGQRRTLSPRRCSGSPHWWTRRWRPMSLCTTSALSYARAVPQL